MGRVDLRANARRAGDPSTRSTVASTDPSLASRGCISLDEVDDDRKVDLETVRGNPRMALPAGRSNT